MKRENDVWEIVNRKGKKKKRINKGIEMEECKEHFMKLDGVESRIVKGNRGRGEYLERYKDII